MKARARALQARLAEVLQLVKLKSPSVLLQLQRTASGGGGTPSKAAPGSLSPASSMSPLNAIKSSGGAPTSGGKAFY
jgi:hypothetical protein